MAADKGWGQSAVKDLLDNGPEDNAVDLNQPLPIHISYFTASVDETGQVKKFADVYGHEQRIKHGIAGRFDRIAKQRDHLAPVKVPAYAGGGDDWYFEDGGRRGYRQRYTYSYGYPPQQYPRKKYKPVSGFFKQVFGGY